MNGDLALGKRERLKPLAGDEGETTNRESASPVKTGEDRRKTQGDERSSSSGFHIAKSGAEVAGPGL